VQAPTLARLQLLLLRDVMDLISNSIVDSMTLIDCKHLVLELLEDDDGGGTRNL
jgi:hypothetical protein